MIFPDKVYDVLKWICLIAIPAICTAISQIGQLFGWAEAHIVAEIGVILCTLLGTLLGISNYQYNHNLPESAEIDTEVDTEETHEDKGVM